jgi:hypothetical protein
VPLRFAVSCAVSFLSLPPRRVISELLLFFPATKVAIYRRLNVVNQSSRISILLRLVLALLCNRS